MVQPGLTPEQRLAQVAQLRGQADDVMGALRAKMAAVQQAQQHALSVTGQASSRDGSVRATVDATGVLTDLRLSPEALRAPSPEKLASTVVATVQRAAEQARSAMRQTLAPVTDQRALDTAREHVPGLAALQVPAVPRTASDPGDLGVAPAPAASGGLSAVHELDDQPTPALASTPAPAPQAVPHRPASRPAPPAEDDEDFSAQSPLGNDEW